MFLARERRGSCGLLPVPKRAGWCWSASQPRAGGEGGLAEFPPPQRMFPCWSCLGDRGGEYLCSSHQSGWVSPNFLVSEVPTSSE